MPFGISRAIHSGMGIATLVLLLDAAANAQDIWYLEETQSDPGKRSREEPQMWEGKNMGGHDLYVLRTRIMPEVRGHSLLHQSPNRKQLLERAVLQFPARHDPHRRYIRPHDSGQE